MLDVRDMQGARAPLAEVSVFRTAGTARLCGGALTKVASSESCLLGPQAVGDRWETTPAATVGGMSSLDGSSALAQSLVCSAKCSQHLSTAVISLLFMYLLNGLD